MSQTVASRPAPTQPLPSRAVAVGQAVAATALGTGLGHLVSSMTAPESSPVFAVGSTAIDLAPQWLKNWAVATFGTADKPVLLGGIGVVLLALTVWAGLVGRRRPWRAAAILGAMALLALVAGMRRPASDPTSALPGLVTAAVGLAAYVRLRLPPVPEPRKRARRTPATGARLDRRAALALGGIAALGTAAGAWGQRRIGEARAMIASLPPARRPLPPLPEGLEHRVRGIEPFQTPAKDFYRIDTALVVPDVSADDWRLVVDGDVEERLELTFGDLLAMELVEADVALACVSNEVGGGYAGAARWLGVPVRELLARARPRPGNDQVLSTSVDGFTCSTPLETLTDERPALLAVGMHGAPLPREHGYPVRMVTPGLYGYVGATKWVTKLTVTRYADRRAYWSTRGWSERGPIKPMARIDTPRTRVGAGRVAIGGTAWAQQQGIVGVQVQVDDGPWRDAELGPDAGIDYWRQWWLPWDATPGDHVLRARCRYADGRTQTPEQAPPAPDGASGWHTVRIQVS